MASAAEPTPPAPRKKFGDVLLTATPVILTVIGTLLAGLANSEMTQAQYRRSMAAQFQSKTSDQWNYFQAKRIRRTTLETAASQTPVFSFRGEWNLDRLTFLFDRLALARRQTASELKTLREKVGPSPKTGAEVDDELRALLAAWDKPIDEKRDRELVTALANDLTKPDNKKAFDDLCAAKLPAVNSSENPDVPPEAAAVAKAVAAALADVRDLEQSHKPEEATANRYHDLNRGAVELAIQSSIERSAARAKEIEDSFKPIAKVLRFVEERLTSQLGEAERVHRVVQRVELALAKISTEGRATIQSEVSVLQTADRALGVAANESKDAVLGLKDDFDARRYQAESDANKVIAEHYEVMVRFQGMVSERHRLRSKQFFYGMLCAQAGVVIASTALAAKQKSVLWSLAAVAGATALTFAVYVYLFV